MKLLIRFKGWLRHRRAEKAMKESSGGRYWGWNIQRHGETIGKLEYLGSQLPAGIRDDYLPKWNPGKELALDPQVWAEAKLTLQNRHFPDAVVTDFFMTHRQEKTIKLRAAFVPYKYFLWEAGGSLFPAKKAENESNFGRRFGWYIERNGERLGELDYLRWDSYGQFWHDYELKWLPGKEVQPYQHEVDPLRDDWSEQKLVLRHKHFTDVVISGYLANYRVESTVSIEHAPLPVECFERELPPGSVATTL